jgi:hypothetical protein
VHIDFGGSLPRKVFSRLSPSLASWLAQKVVAFFGRVCAFFCVVGSPRQDPYSG